MDTLKMANRVVPMLTPRAAHYLAGASAGVQATLLSGVDVGVVRANIEGLAGFAEAHGLTLDGMVEIGSGGKPLGSAPTPALGAAVDDAHTWWMNSNFSLNKLSAAVKAQSMTQADGSKIVQGELVYAAQQVCQAAGTASGQANSSQDPGDISAAQQANSYCNLAQTNVQIGNGLVSKLPKTLGGDGPVTTKCPDGQHLDASGKCVPDTAPPEAPKSSMNWWLIGAGVAAGAVILWAVMPEEDKKKLKGARGGTHHSAAA